MKTVDHIAVLVENLEVSQKWYEKVCGAELIFDDFKYKRMQLNNTTIALIDKKHYEYAHIGLIVENYNDLPLNEGEVVQHRDGTTGCYMTDPDGNVVELIHYNQECKNKLGIEE